MKKPALVAQHRAGGEVTSIWKDNSVSNGINNAQQDTTGQGRTQADAQEFGQHVRQGGWRLGLLVARNVVRAPGRVSIETLAPKTNATRFGELSGVSTTKVLRYLAAWNLAAEQGSRSDIAAEPRENSRKVSAQLFQLKQLRRFLRTPLHSPFRSDFD